MMIRGELTTEDLLKPVRRLVLTRAAYVLPWLLVVAFATSLQVRWTWVARAVYLPFLFLACGIALSVWPPAFCRTFLQAQLLGENERWAGPVEARMTEERLVLTTARGTLNWPWSRFIRFTVMDDAVLLYHAEEQYFVFPFRWFTSEELSGFIDMLQTRVKKPLRWWRWK